MRKEKERVEKECEYRNSVNREGVRVEKESREGVRVKKEEVEKECE